VQFVRGMPEFRRREYIVGLIELEKILIQYEIDGALKYLSHLELMRALERSFRRAGIEIEVSQGFNPRPKISYGPAHPVGMGSLAEYMIVDIKEQMSESELKEKISYALPKGLSVHRAKYIPRKNPSIMSMVQSAAYRVEIEVGGDVSGLESLINRLRSEERLLVRHKGKEKWVETNQSILDWHIEKLTGKVAIFYILLSAGDKNSVRPEIVIEKLSEMFPQLGEVEVIGIQRIDQYINREIPLMNIYNFYESVKIGSESDKS